MNLLDVLADIERNDEMHMARLLILLKAFVGNDGRNTVDGLTKLAKLDFLLRYPVYLDRALKARVAQVPDVRIADHEKKSVESSMIRYHYGPWDPRYRRFLNLLISKGLAYVRLEGNTIRIGLTPEGIEKATILYNNEDFSDISYRSELLSKHFDISATRLKNFIYETFPEIISLELGEEIRYEY